MNVYTPQFVRDLNADGVPDVVAIHGGDPLAEAGMILNLFYGRIHCTIRKCLQFPTALQAV